jgi:hypothetical protein
MQLPDLLSLYKLHHVSHPRTAADKEDRGIGGLTVRVDSDRLKGRKRERKEERKKEREEKSVWSETAAKHSLS